MGEQMTITDRIRAVMRPGCTHEQLLGDVIAEIERLQADAARYRWLRGDVPSHSLRWGRWEVRNWTGRYWDDMRKDGLDAAIDAAMKGE